MRKFIFLLLAITIAGCARSTKPIEENRLPITVGILYFENTSKSEKLKPLSAGLMDMFITELGRAPELKVVERKRLDKILQELKINQSSMMDQSTAQKIGRLLGAQTLYYGGYMELMGQLQLNGHLFRVETGELIASAGGRCDAGNSKEILKLVERVSQEIRSQIRRNYRALLADIYYSRGRDYEETGDIQKALSQYQKALSLQPDHSLSKEAIRRLSGYPGSPSRF